MKLNVALKSVALLAFAVGALLAPVRAQAAAGAPPYISPQALEILKLSQSGVDDSVTVAYVSKSPGKFNLSADDVVYLKKSGLSPAAITAMVNRDAALRSQPQPSATPSASANNASAASAATPVAPAPAPQIPNVPGIPDAPTVAPIPGVLPPTTTQPPTQKSIVVDQAPPPPRLEVVPLSPGPRYVWIPGYWGYRAGLWNWVGGTWVLRPHPTAIWVGGHWSHHGHGWIWVSGRWR